MTMMMTMVVTTMMMPTTTMIQSRFFVRSHSCPTGCHRDYTQHPIPALLLLYEDGHNCISVFVFVFVVRAVGVSRISADLVSVSLDLATVGIHD